MDMRPPVESAIRSLRCSITTFPSLPLPPMPWQGDAEKCLAAGMSDYISKPIDPKILAEVVEKWLTRKTHDAPGAAPSESALASKMRLRNRRMRVTWSSIARRFWSA